MVGLHYCSIVCLLELHLGLFFYFCTIGKVQNLVKVLKMVFKTKSCAPRGQKRLVTSAFKLNLTESNFFDISIFDLWL